MPRGKLATPRRGCLFGCSATLCGLSRIADTALLHECAGRAAAGCGAGRPVSTLSTAGAVGPTGLYEPGWPCAQTRAAPRRRSPPRPRTCATAMGLPLHKMGFALPHASPPCPRTRPRALPSVAANPETEAQPIASHRIASHRIARHGTARARAAGGRTVCRRARSLRRPSTLADSAVRFSHGRMHSLG